MRILQHHPEGVTQIGLLYLFDVDVVVAYLAVLYVVETVDEVGDGGLARARRPDKRYFLPRSGDEVDVFEHRFFRDVAESHILELHFSRPSDVSRGVVRLVIMFPRPFARAFLALRDVAVSVHFRIDQRDVALVFLGFGVDEREYAFSARQRHKNAVHLLGHLPYGGAELSGILQEGHQHTYLHTAYARNHKQRARNRGDGVVDVAQIAQDGHKHVGVSVRLARRAAQRGVDVVERRLFRVLVTEHLDDAHTLDMLFHIAVQHAYRLLLAHEMLARLPADVFDDEEHNAKHHEYEERKQRAQHHHHNENAYDGESVGDEIRHAVRHKLAQGVRIVGVAAHNVAVGVSVEKAYGQLLHIFEHLVADVALYLRGHIDDNPVVEILKQHARDVKHRHHARHYGEIGHRDAARAFRERTDVVVDEDGQHKRAAHRCADIEHESDTREYHSALIRLEIGQNTLESGHGMTRGVLLSAAVRSGFFGLCAAHSSTSFPSAYTSAASSEPRCWE